MSGVGRYDRDDSDLIGELAGVVVCSRAVLDFDGVWGGEEVVSWSLDVSFNRRLDDTEFENILVVGVVSRDTPDEILQQVVSLIGPEIVFPLYSNQFWYSLGIRKNLPWRIPRWRRERVKR